MVKIYLLIGFQITLIIFTSYIIFTVIAMLINWKNVLPFVPTSRKISRRMVELLGAEDGDRIVDIGSGWGTLVFQAGKQGALVTGVERSRFLHIVANVRRVLNRNKSRIQFIRGDAFEQRYSEYNKVIGFWIPIFIKRLAPKLTDELPNGAKVASYMFRFPEHPSWKETIHTYGKNVIYLYEKTR